MHNNRPHELGARILRPIPHGGRTRMPEKRFLTNYLLLAFTVVSSRSRIRVAATWEGCQWGITDMNGGRSAILKKNDRPTLTISLSCNEAGLVSDIFITLNPDKLARLEPVDIH
jgi:hypothetical protein